MDNFDRLHRALNTGDLELRFHDGRSIKAHKTKLQLACLDGVLNNLIEDVVDDQITAGTKRKRTGDSDTAADHPCLKVRGCAPHDTFIASGAVHKSTLPVQPFIHVSLSLHKGF